MVEISQLVNILFQINNDLLATKNIFYSFLFMKFEHKVIIFRHL